MVELPAARLICICGDDMHFVALPIAREVVNKVVGHLDKQNLALNQNGRLPKWVVRKAVALIKKTCPAEKVRLCKNFGIWPYR